MTGVIVYAVAVRTAVGQWLDNLVLVKCQSLFPAPLDVILSDLVRVALVAVLILVVLVLAARALWRRRWRPVASALLTGTVAVPLTWFLRVHVFTRPDLTSYGYPYNTMPSTHAALAYSLLLSVALLWPRPPPTWLTPTLCGGVVVVLAGNVATQAHMPSDILVSGLVVVAAGLATTGLLRPSVKE